MRSRVRGLTIFTSTSTERDGSSELTTVRNIQH